MSESISEASNRMAYNQGYQDGILAKKNNSENYSDKKTSDLVGWESDRKAYTNGFFDGKQDRRNP